MSSPTLADIARQANVSKSLVSKALHHHPRVARKTVERIEKLAKELGYFPNPLLASLASKKFRSASSVDQTPLAYIIQPESSEQHQPDGFMCRTISEFASQTGYAFSPYHLSEYKSSKHLSEVLYQRGVAGVIFAPITRDSEVHPEEWARFAVVMIGLGRVQHPYTSISMDFFRGINVIWDRLKNAGCEKIGFLQKEDTAKSLEAQQRLATYYYHREQQPKKSRIPILTYSKDARGVEEIMQWYRKHQPDGIIVNSQRPYEIMRDQGVQIPEEVRMVSVWNHFGFEGELAALRDMRYEVCTQAVQLIDKCIRYRELGAQDPVSTLTITPRWIPGTSCPEPG